MLTSEQLLLLPDGSEVLDIQEQGGNIYAWVKLDTSNPDRERKFVIYGTGNPIEETNLLHISTLQMGMMVWHFFEDLTPN